MHSEGGTVVLLFCKMRNFEKLLLLTFVADESHFMIVYVKRVIQHASEQEMLARKYFTSGEIRRSRKIHVRHVFEEKKKFILKFDTVKY